MRPVKGEPRLTHDIDLLVAITPQAVQQLTRAFPIPDYYLSEAAAREAIGRKSQFNLLDVTGGDKVDFWVLTDEPFDQSRFARRYRDDFDGQPLYVSRPEDTILMKLLWAQMSGGSEKQMGDARSVFEVQRLTLDTDYIEEWSDTLRVTALWERLKRES